MAITVTCPGCNTSVRIEAETAGSAARCPACQQVFALPNAEPPPTAAPKDSAPPVARAVLVAELAGSEAGVRAGRPRPDRNRASPPKSSGGSLVAVVLAVVAGVALLGVLVCAGVLWFAYAFFQRSAAVTQTATRSEWRPPVVGATKAAGPPVEKPAGPPRPPFGDAGAARVTFTEGAFRAEGRFTDTDPFDRDAQVPAKVFLAPLEAGMVYFAEAKREGNVGLGPEPRLRLEDAAGRTVASPVEGRQPGGSRLLYLAPAAGTYRLVVTSSWRDSGFVLTLRRVEDGDEVPEVPMPPRQVPTQSIQLARKLDAFVAAAVAPDSKSAWVAYADGKLQRFACPEFETRGTYKLPRRAYQMALDRRGVLYAVVEIDGGKAPALPWWDLGAADLHLYDTRELPAEGAELKPLRVLPLRGVVQHLFVSPDDAWLYFLDTHNRKVGRVDLKQQKLDRENDQITESTNAMCLTPNGKALYTCSSINVVQRLDPATLKVEKTFRIDRGQPNGVQATDAGYVFLNSGEGQHTHVYLLNAGRDYTGPRAPVVPWAGVHSTHSIRLAPDQKRLYTACFSLSPSNITSFSVSERPGLFRGQQSGAIGLDGVNARGRMEVSPDGTFLFSDRGLILLLGR